MQALQASALFKHPGLAAAEHHHDGLERHHHGPGDATVQAVDSANTDAAADAGTAQAAQPVPAWAWMTETLAAPAAPAGSAWPAAAAPTWTSALARLPERPPRA
jgi:hypothetical protein